ncbi:MAG: addiction module toxin RelE [Ignavibacteria bacterium]|nr:addiction module toxin RelE [Ignavibacteria bacterium]
MEIKQKHRTIIFYKDYFQEFFVKQRDKVKDKIIWTLETQKTPIKEIKKALIIKEQYENETK